MIIANKRNILSQIIRTIEWIENMVEDQTVMNNGLMVVDLWSYLTRTGATLQCNMLCI